MLLSERHRRVVENIKKNIRLGHDILEIKKELSKNGLMESEIHKAVDDAYSEIEKDEKKKKKIISFFALSKEKSIFVIAIITMLLLHLYGNIAILPELGRIGCEQNSLRKDIDRIKDEGKIEDESMAKIGELEGKNLELQKEKLDEYKRLLILNFPMIITRAYYLNPMFETPCEIKEIMPSFNCGFYITEEQHKCAYEEEYDNIGIGIVLNSILLVMIFYIIGCGFAKAHDDLKKKLNPKTKEIVEYATALVIVLLIVSAVYIYLYIMSAVIS